MLVDAAAVSTRPVSCVSAASLRDSLAEALWSFRLDSLHEALNILHRRPPDICD